ncbi:MAG: metallopeptidase family protein, partial [Aestuariivirga sp.]
MTGRSLSGLSAPSLNDIERLAAVAFEGLPAEFRKLCGEIVFRVEDFPADDVLDEMAAETPFDILGLFQGVGLAQDAAVAETGRLPNMVYLY